MEFVQLTGGRPAQLLSHVRYVVKFSSARNNAQRKVQELLKALHDVIVLCLEFAVQAFDVIVLAVQAKNNDIQQKTR